MIKGKPALKDHKETLVKKARKEIKVMGILNKLSLALIPAIAMSLWAGSSQAAQQNCAKRDDAIKTLSEKYNEKIVSRGLAKGGKSMVEVFASDSGSWTVIVTNTEGLSCIVASGESWHDVPSASAAANNQVS